MAYDPSGNTDQIDFVSGIYYFKGPSGPLATIYFNYNIYDYYDYDHVVSDVPTGLQSGSGGSNWHISPYSNNIIYEFEPIFNLNTGNLSTTTTVYAVHRSKDVSFIFGVTDRQLNILNSTTALLENPFVRSVDIDILNRSGTIVSGDYVTGSFNNSITLTEAQNTGIFDKSV
jgi:hypothetical protein